MDEIKPVYIRVLVPSASEEWSEWEQIPEEGIPPFVTAEEVGYIRPTLEMLFSSGATSMVFDGDIYSKEFCFDPELVNHEAVV